jgi:hypothetical protein
MILLDWTRMGSTYCVAGVVVQDNRLRVVRPLQAHKRDAPVRNIGWSAFLMDGHSRWEVFELIDPVPAEGQPPHLEDVWVRELRPRRRLASPAQRRAILEATRTPPERPPFGVPLTTTRSAAYLSPGTGTRSLASVVVPVGDVAFSASQREGVAEPDYRVTLNLPGLEERVVSLKDHFLLQRAELAGQDLERQVRELTIAVRQMGDEVVVRLGLSRAFQGTPQRSEGVCWLMADGFFSRADPQP